MFCIRDEEVAQKVRAVKGFALDEIDRDKDVSLVYKKMSKDENLQRHCKNVADLSTAVGIGYGFNLAELIDIYVGALLHDAGKVRLNQNILYKVGILTKDERAYTETHTTIGYKLLKNTSLSEIALEIVRSHHEKIDGNGYPCSLEKKEISIYTQIVTVCDMYEAMTSDRCYRKALSSEDAIKILKSDSGINEVALAMLQENIAEPAAIEINAFKFA